jgi:hypothetical protein
MTTCRIDLNKLNKAIIGRDCTRYMPKIKQESYSTTKFCCYKISINRLKTKHICFIYKDPVRTAHYTLSFSVIKINQLMLYREVIAICSEIRTHCVGTT